MMENEIKVRIPDPKAFRSKLLSLGAEIRRERHPESNVLFDFPDGRLRETGCALRLRLARRRVYLTFKGPAGKERRFKAREEFETEVRGLREARRILQRLGLRPVFRYAKLRTDLRLDKVTVSLDETALGYFVELEG